MRYDGEDVQDRNMITTACVGSTSNICTVRAGERVGISSEAIKGLIEVEAATGAPMHTGI